MDEGTSSKRSGSDRRRHELSGLNSLRPGGSSTSKSRTPLRSPAGAALTAPEVAGVLSQPVNTQSRTGRTPTTSTPTAGDYFSQPTVSAAPGFRAVSPASHRRSGTPRGEARVWGGHGRKGSLELPEDEIHEASQEHDWSRTHVAGGAQPGPSRLIQMYHQAQEEKPSYPNQSFTALAAQKYPTYHPAPFNAKPIVPQNRVLNAARVLPIRGEDPVEARLRTIANTPVSTPGLFLSQSTISAFGLEGTGGNSPYPSPYLHPTQLQPPRTTTNARKDVDVMSGRKMVNHYEILDELGRGVHGKVKLARNLETGEQVAIKIVQRYSKKRRLGKLGTPEDKVKKEVAILKKAQHPNVVRMLEVIDDPDISKVYIVLEFCELKEIVWRTLGVPEIVILENRRLEAEKYGVTDLDPTKLDDMTRAAAERLESQSRMRPLRRRTKSSYWSLEYGGSSEEEDEGEEPGFRSVISALDLTPTGSPGQASRPMLHSSEASHEDHHALVREISPRDDSRSPSESVTEAQEDEFGEFRNLAFGSPWQPRQVSNSYNTSADHHASDDPHGKRRQSKADSIASQMTDAMEMEVHDEELRYVPTMTMSECRSAFRDALVGLDYLHYQGIIHRDIKPANLLRTREHMVKISDFGVSYLGKPIRDGEESADTSGSESADFEEETELAKTVGTPAFYAPELCSLDYTHELPPVTGQIDVWALGATLYCMLFARTPFQAENEFMLMRRIAEEEVVIPKRRLKAVQTKNLPRSPSYGPHRSLEKRLPEEWAHEIIDDELDDLLRRLFVKNPKKRITIKEIKYHPWVLRELPNPHNWIDETDPARMEEGKKIEVSKEDVAEAVIPLKVIARIKSLTNRAGRVFGLSGRTSGRKRGDSSATPSEAGSSASLHSAIDSLSKDPKRQSLRAGDTIFDALRASREREFEHPLSRSVTASPDPESRHGSSTASSRQSSNTPAPPDPIVAPRPTMPDRQTSELSTAASVRTLRPSDFEQNMTSPTIDEAPQEDEFAGTEQVALGQMSGASLSAVFGGAGNSRNFRRPISRQPTNSGSQSSSTFTSPEHVGSPTMPYGEPSIALSNAVVAGQVHLPESLAEIISPLASRHGSVASISGSSRKSSSASQSGAPSSSVTPAVTSPGWHGGTQVNMGGGLSAGAAEYTTREENVSDEQFNQAMDTLTRRRLLEMELEREQHNASRNASRLTPRDRSACPPSPDDDPAVAAAQPSRSAVGGPDFFTEAHNVDGALMHPMSSTSSEDQFNLSQSTSYPSMPSVSSFLPDVEPVTYPAKPSPNDSTGSSEGTVHEEEHKPVETPLSPRWSHRLSAPVPSRTTSYDDGYAVETEEDDDSDDEGFIMMSKRRTTRAGSISNAQLSRRRERTESVRLARRQTRTRSGSANTMKKLRSNSGGSSSHAPEAEQRL